MDKELIDATKSKICYTEELAPTCERCKHHEEKEDQYLDRSWVHYCKINPLCEFKVSRNGRCNFFCQK